MFRFALLALLLTSQMAFCAAPVIEASDARLVAVEQPVKVAVPAGYELVPAAKISASNPWLDILYSPPVVVLIATLCVQLLQYFKQKKGLDDDRWVGLVHNLYGVAEKAGAMKGNEKLSKALELFDSTFMKTYGKRPTAQDRADVENDLARIAIGTKTTKKQSLS